MTAPELKPCPFCGGKPYLANVEMVGCSYVVCTDCRAQGDDATKEGAIANWNARASAPDTRVVTVAQLERWLNCLVSFEIKDEIRAIIGGQANE